MAEPCGLWQSEQDIFAVADGMCELRNACALRSCGTGTGFRFELRLRFRFADTFFMAIVWQFSRRRRASCAEPSQ